MDDKDFVWTEHSLKPGFKRPVIVHRAILGSVERFLAVLIEHLGGKWPLWISPRQIIVLPISEKAHAYCEKVQLYLHHQGFEVSVDKSKGSIDKKVRNAQLAQWNYILVAGAQEMDEGTVDVRSRDTVRHGKMRVDAVASWLKTMYPKPSSAHDNFYKNMWNPADYPVVAAESKPAAESEAQQ
jgi:threonyl-tRNA synthetase